MFRNRRDAGQRLAALLEPLRGESPTVVGIARGGMSVAAEVARILAAPLDVAVVRKIGAPRSPEYAVGALAEAGVRVLNSEALRALKLSEATLDALVEQAKRELDEQLARYRDARKPVPLAGHTAIAIDDGLATGSTALAALAALRARGAKRLILAVPVAARTSIEALRRHADGIVCLEESDELWAVGYWYEDFRPTTDEEVIALLDKSARS